MRELLRVSEQGQDPGLQAVQELSGPEEIRGAGKVKESLHQEAMCSDISGTTHLPQSSYNFLPLNLSDWFV